MRRRVYVVLGVLAIVGAGAFVVGVMTTSDYAKAPPLPCTLLMQDELEGAMAMALRDGQAGSTGESCTFFSEVGKASEKRDAVTVTVIDGDTVAKYVAARADAQAAGATVRDLTVDDLEGEIVNGEIEAEGFAYSAGSLASVDIRNGSRRVRVLIQRPASGIVVDSTVVQALAETASRRLPASDR